MNRAADDDLDLRLPGGRRVRAADVIWRATTSGGPGGQHANRTASRVEVVVSIPQLPLEPREQALLYERLASRLSGAGDITVGVAEHRDQRRNRVLALRRMERLIADALRVRTARVPTKPSYGARLRARSAKQQHSQRKRSRGRQWDGSDE